MAGAASKKNVIVGAAALFVANQYTTGATPTAIVRPTPVAATRYATTVRASVDWRDVGYTQEGVEISYEPDFGDVEVDQLLDSARVFKSSMRVMVNTTFAEATLENLLLVWAQPASTLTGSATPVVATGETFTLSVSGGNIGDTPLEKQLIAVGVGPEGTASGLYSERSYHVTRAISVESSSHALRRAEATVYPVSFRLLPDDTTGTNNPYGTIRDRAYNSGWV